MSKNVGKSIIAMAMILVASICACTTATSPKDVPEPEPSYALQPGKDGAFAVTEAVFAEKHDTRKSGFLLLDNNAKSLHQRLMLIDEARYSLDIQYYTLVWGR
jgi:hypothetical protein